MKKLLTVITALILALSSLMAGAFAAEYDDNDVVLVAITNDGIIVSEPTSWASLKEANSPAIDHYVGQLNEQVADMAASE